MWKWTDADNIKVIILDVNSLDEEYLIYPYNHLISDVQLFFVRHIDTLGHFELSQDIMTYFDTTSLLQEILLESKCDSTSIISISSNPLFLKEMMQNHIGTILTNEIKKELLKSTPDFTKCTIEILPNILGKERKGYAAEVFATYNQGKKTISLLKCQSEIQLSSGEDRKVDLYFGGRYYSDSHKYLLNDPLSYVVQEFKFRYVNIVDDFFDATIKFIRGRETIDILTFIPLKPDDIKNEKFDRFATLNLKENAKDEFKLENILLCRKNFTQKGSNYIQRLENPKGAYTVLPHKDIHGKNIIIIDDVFSTGSTISEAIKTLYENGANKVIAVILAVNQLTESILEYQNLTCPCCGSEMTLRMNSQNGKLFFGCKGYKQHSDKPYTIDTEIGLSKLKNKNKLLVSDIIDLEDEY